ncbi:MAG: beta-ketoacyl synthase N-terminal-like domain-containing protein, partial [Myxococcota bacterium]
MNHPSQSPDRGAVAIVGLGAVLPEAPNVSTLWKNLETGRYSITETPNERWEPAKYFDPDPKAPDKTYSKIGGWVIDYPWDPFRWKMPIPPKVADSMDRTQKWAVAAAREALMDYGVPDRPLDRDRTAIIVGNAMGGDKHYMTAMRIYAPEFLEQLEASPSFSNLTPAQRELIAKEFLTGVQGKIPDITEDTMPGELANIIAGRIAAVFDLHGPNFVADAACASAMAAMSAAMEGLDEHHFDAVVTGGVDANMSASTFVKFCKIGALSATGTRPYDEGADGFVMGEGAAMFVMKRLADAERDGDKIYAVLRGLGGASDGKGKGITAPNPVGQRLAVRRAWEIAGERPDVDTMMEGHGTSTRVGDVVEVQSLTDVLSDFDLPVGSIPLGSIKSNIGHLKGAAGAAGILKATLALHHKAIPPSLNLSNPNPKIEFGKTPFFVNTELRSWDKKTQGVRRAGVSAFGFGGTNFHAVLEEHEPGRLTRPERAQVSVSAPIEPKAPLRGGVVLGGSSPAEIRNEVRSLLSSAKQGRLPAPTAPEQATLTKEVRLAVDFKDGAELTEKLELADKALASGNPMAFKPLRARGIHIGSGAPPKVAFLYTGQGSQYVNMLAALKEVEPIVRDTIAEADSVMTPILGRPLSSIIYVDPTNEAAMAQANEELRQTAITQPAVLTVDIAMTRLMAEYGIKPDMVMGHSLGEYGALVAAGGMTFAHALEAVAARGREMTQVSMGDNGKMAAVMGPFEQIQAVVDAVDGYVVMANLNSRRQAVIGGASPAVEKAVEMCQAQGLQAQLIPVSHAFHTSIVAPASGPMMNVLRRLDLKSVTTPLVGNVDAEFYPTGPGAPEKMVEILGQQIASPVQFIKGLEKLHDAGARVFVEMGPKKALQGFAEDVLGDREATLSLFTNHPKIGDAAAFNQALMGLYSRGLGRGRQPAPAVVPEVRTDGRSAAPVVPMAAAPAPTHAPVASRGNGQSAMATPVPAARVDGPTFGEVGRLFAQFMEDAFQVMGQGGPAYEPSVVVTGVSLGLPGHGAMFRNDNVARLLRGESFIEPVPPKTKDDMVERHITRLVKSSDGSGSFETISSSDAGIKLAGQPGSLGLVEDFGYPADRASALDSTTAMAIAAGIDALRNAGIPLVMNYKTTTRGTFLPERWMLPEALRDETGVVFGSAFPGLDAFANEAEGFRKYSELVALRDELQRLHNGRSQLAQEIKQRIAELDHDIQQNAYILDRRFVFRVLAMGHSQFAEYIGARGPNTQINAACASGTQGLGVAQDWIRAGRCRRVIVLSADNVTSPSLMPWIGSGFLASGAAATDARVEDAALPFDRRRHGLILGMGAAAMVVESADAVAERGHRPMTEVMATRFVNSAFHGTRLDPQHITSQVEALVSEAEAKFGVSRAEMAEQMVFISHETFTPARGGSAQTEVLALRNVFGEHADKIVVANTKGMTGHAMGTGIEDILGVASLETGEVPKVPNFREVDPELGRLNLSTGGSYPIEYALRLGAGFGSQLALSLVRRVPGRTRPRPEQVGYESRIEDGNQWTAWLAAVSGHVNAEVETVNRTLRIKDLGPTDAAVRQALADRLPKPAVASLSVPAFTTARVEARARIGGGAGAVPASPPPQSARPQSVPAPSMNGGAGPVTSTPASPQPAPSAPSATDSVQAKIMEIVAQQTGYPPDMLDPELDLEADLGIDTVKQAEMFAAVRE